MLSCYHVILVVCYHVILVVCYHVILVVLRANLLIRVFACVVQVELCEGECCTRAPGFALGKA
jgi:hypothetical protein